MKKGFTIVEMLVAIALFSVITAIAVGGFTSALRTQRQVAALIGAQSNVSLALEQITREMRTGYLFCHDTSNNPTCACVGGGTNSCGVALPGPGMRTQNLNFWNSASAEVVYSLVNNTLMRSDSSAGGVSQGITGDKVSVKYLYFTITGNAEGDHRPPRITISLGVAPSSTDAAIANNVLNLQTSVSARQIDCNTSGASPSC